MTARRRLLSLAVTAGAAASALLPATAHAGALVASGESCEAQRLSRPFLPWLDVMRYTPVPGGSFEGGSPSWSLGGDAAVVDGNEPFHVNAASDSKALRIPYGSSATSAPVCLGVEEPTLRFFVKRTGGAPLSSLKVDVIFEDASGNVMSALVGVALAGPSWSPSNLMMLVVNLLPLIGDKTPVAFQFTPVLGGTWTIDDVYVDPTCRC